MPVFNSSAARVLCALAATFVFAASAFATTLTWTGSAGDGKWSSAANWNPAQVPQSGNDLTFPANLGTVTVTNDLADGTVLHSLAFDQHGSRYTVAGNRVDVSSSLTATASGYFAIFESPVRAADSLAFDNIEFQGAFDANTQSIEIGAAIFDAPVTGNGTMTVRRGATFNAENPFSGRIVVSAGSPGDSPGVNVNRSIAASILEATSLGR